MNASALLNFFLNKKIFKLNLSEIKNISNKIGSDVIIGMYKSPLLIINSSKVKELKKKLDYYVVILKPNFGCSTKEIYKNLKSYSKPNFSPYDMKKLTNKKILNSFNDLENPAFKKYPQLKNIKLFMENLEKKIFVRMSGSGSSLVGYFFSKNAAIKAHKLLKKKYKNYWCILSKTI